MKTLCGILHLCANYIESCPGDILIDFPRMYEQYKSGETIYLTVRKTGADTIERFEDCILESKGLRRENLSPKEVRSLIPIQDSLAYAMRTLGIDFVLKIEQSPKLSVEIWPNPTSMTRWALEDIVSRLVDYRYIPKDRVKVLDDIL